MSQAIQPIQASLSVAWELKLNLELELQTSLGQRLSQDLGGPIFPLVRSPEAEMYSQSFTPALMGGFMQITIVKYGSADVEMLQSDPDKLARFVEVSHASWPLRCFTTPAYMAKHPREATCLTLR